MATAATVIPRNQGKTDFVRDVLTKNARANAKTVKDEWVKSGHEGTISETLVNKMRSEMGLAGTCAVGVPRAPRRQPPRSPSIPGRRGAEAQVGSGGGLVGSQQREIGGGATCKGR